MADESNLEKRLSGLEMHFEGAPGELGMRAKLEIVWRSYVAAWTLVGTVIGVVMTLVVTKFVG